MNNNKIWIVVIIAVAIGIIGFYSLNSKNEKAEADSMAGSQQAMNANPSMAPAEGVMVGGALMTPDKDIVNNAVNSKDHTTVVAAVKAAGLVDTLKSEGPFTVFAPTNAAFEKLPKGTVESLLMPENKDKLTGILTYHVVPGRYTSKDITEGMTLTTVQGQDLTFTMKDGKWWINGSAMIEIADVISSNGVTHVIDSVLLPQ